VDAYVDSGEPMDKAGAYGIQGMGAALVESVDGDFFNVMGFPIQAFQRLLERYGLRYAFGSALGPATDPVRSVGGG
jgi:septum formation protein